MSEHLRSAEDVALEVTAACPEVSDGACFHGAPVGQCIDLKAAADLIRAYAAEVREAARAEALAGFEWQRAECEGEYVDDHCHDDLHASWRDLEDSRVKVRRGVYERRDLRPRRLVGPWEPAP